MARVLMMLTNSSRPTQSASPHKANTNFPNYKVTRAMDTAIAPAKNVIALGQRSCLNAEGILILLGSFSRRIMGFQSPRARQ